MVPIIKTGRYPSQTVTCDAVILYLLAAEGPPPNQSLVLELKAQPLLVKETELGRAASKLRSFKYDVAIFALLFVRSTDAFTSIQVPVGKTFVPVP